MLTSVTNNTLQSPMNKGNAGEWQAIGVLKSQKSNAEKNESNEEGKKNHDQ